MNIIIGGAGEVGRHSAEVLAPAGHNITVVDTSQDKLHILDELLDVRSMVGSCAHADVLVESGCANADLFIAATNSDEINLLAASIAKAVGCDKCVARVHHSAFFDKRGLDYGRHLGVNHLVCPEHTTAQAIASTLRTPGAFAVERFASGRIEMQSIPVSKDARAVGAMLKDLVMPGSARIAAIERSGTAFLPQAETVIHPGDYVTLIGDAKHFDKTCRLFDTESRRRQRVVIMGGSKHAVWLCRALKHRNFAVRLFEANELRANELSEKLDWVTVIQDDAATTDVLQDERIDQVDAFVAMKDEDEVNILAAARAKSMGARMAMAVLQRSTFMHLLEHVGIDRAFSPKDTAVAEILRLIDTRPVRQIASLWEGAADVYEISVPKVATRVVETPLREVAFPSRCLIAAIQRDDEVFVPGAQSVIKAGDTVIIIGPVKSDRDLRKLFFGK